MEDLKIFTKLKLGSHMETIQKVLDVVKRSSNGIDFVILARYEDGMKPEEIAEKMGLSVEQVEKVLEENKGLAMV